MGIIKLIIIALLVWIGFSLFKKLRKPKQNLEQSSPSNNKMLACSVCKTHIPENEAILQDGKVYCSKSCL
jgi:Prokaryotic metallothionein.